MKLFWQSIRLGIARHPWRFCGSILVCYSVLWKVIDSIAAFFPNLKPSGFWAFLILIAVSLIFAIREIHLPAKVNFRLATTSTQIEMCFGDLFGFEGQKAIPVNEFFESSLDGDHVSERSVHGQFIKRRFGGVPQGFDALVEKSLNSVPSVHVDRSSGKSLRYPLGTTAMINLDKERFYLVAVCATDIKTLKASSDVTQLWIALLSLWKKVRTGSSGEDINVPLFGGGLAGIGLPSMQLLQLLVLSIVVATRKSTVANKIRIVLHESKFDEFDLRLIRRDWS